MPSSAAKRVEVSSDRESLELEAERLGYLKPHRALAPSEAQMRSRFDALEANPRRQWNPSLSELFHRETEEGKQHPFGLLGNQWLLSGKPKATEGEAHQRKSSDQGI